MAGKPLDRKSRALTARLLVLSDILHQSGRQPPLPREPPIQRDALHHHLHSRHAALAPKITAVLQHMADEGRIQQIAEEVEADFQE